MEQESEGMTEIPECPICGEKIVVRRTVFGAYTGCEGCWLMLLTPFKVIPAPKDVDFEHVKETSVKAWKDMCMRSSDIHSVRTENILRTAYGMPQVSYLDFVERDILRRVKE
jgi:hypothetical protein